MSHLGHSSHSLWTLYFLHTHLHSNSESHTSAAGFPQAFQRSGPTHPCCRRDYSQSEKTEQLHLHYVQMMLHQNSFICKLDELALLWFALAQQIRWWPQAQQKPLTCGISQSSRVNVHLQLFIMTNNGFMVLTADGFQLNRQPTGSTLYSHASFHYQRLDSAAARCQRKVDAPVVQDHPLAPQPAALKQSDGRQGELLGKPRWRISSSLK